MTLHQLKIFMAVASFLNFRKAAEELHISQPSVFVQFKKLQEEYNLRLYRKKGRAIELTHHGELFVRYAKAILIQVEAFERRFRGNGKDKEPAILRIGGCHVSSTAFLPRLITAFRAGHRDVDISLRTQNSRAIEEMILNSDIDLGVITGPPSSPLIQYEQCGKDPVVAFASPKYFTSKGLSLTQLAMKPLQHGLCGSRGIGIDSKHFSKTQAHSKCSDALQFTRSGQGHRQNGGMHRYFEPGGPRAGAWARGSQNHQGSGVKRHLLQLRHLPQKRTPERPSKELSCAVTKRAQDRHEG